MLHVCIELTIIILHSQGMAVNIGMTLNVGMVGMTLATHGSMFGR